MADLTWEQVPRTFSMCFSEACPRRAECLHAAAGALMPAPPESAEASKAGRVHVPPEADSAAAVFHAAPGA